MRRYFARAEELSAGGSIIGWWEKRRLPFLLLSVAVLIRSDFSLVAVAVLSVTQILYTGGWIAELGTRRIFRERSEFSAPAALTVLSLVLLAINTPMFLRPDAWMELGLIGVILLPFAGGAILALSLVFNAVYPVVVLARRRARRANQSPAASGK